MKIHEVLRVMLEGKKYQSSGEGKFGTQVGLMKLNTNKKYKDSENIELNYYFVPGSYLLAIADCLEEEISKN